MDERIQLMALQRKLSGSPVEVGDKWMILIK